MAKYFYLKTAFQRHMAFMRVHLFFLFLFSFSDTMRYYIVGSTNNSSKVVLFEQIEPSNKLKSQLLLE